MGNGLGFFNVVYHKDLIISATQRQQEVSFFSTAAGLDTVQ